MVGSRGGGRSFHPGLRFAQKRAPGRRASGDPAVVPRQNSSRIRAKAALLAALALAALAGTVSPASAQGIFDSLFGRRWSRPLRQRLCRSVPIQPVRAARSGSAARRDGGDRRVLRTPLRRPLFSDPAQQGVTPAQTCSSFCPASQTKIYNGSSIDHAVAPDGRRYASSAPPSSIARRSSPAAPATARTRSGWSIPPCR